MFGYSIKKYNRKQRAFNANRVAEHKRKLMFQFSLIVFMVFAVPSTVFAVQTQNEADITSALATGGGGATLAITMPMTAIGNIDDETDIETQGNNIAMEVWLIELSQIDTLAPWPYPNISREVADIPLKEGEYCTRFECHNNPKYLASGELGDYTIDPTKALDFVLANTYKDQVLNFVENKAGGKFIVIFRKVESSQKYVMGTYDKPMRFKSFENKNDDASVALIKFENKAIRQFHKYIGSVQTAPASVLGADVTELVVGNNDKYTTASDNTADATIATVSGIAPADIRREIIVVGGGGTYPHKIDDNAVFILANNETWTGNKGSSITFRVMDTGTLAELDRTQT